MHMVPGSSSWKFLTLENHPQGGGGGTICVLHQPPGVTDVSVLEGSQFVHVGEASDRFPGTLPLFGGFSGTSLGLERWGHPHR